MNDSVLAEIAEPHFPTTVRKEAQEFLRSATPVVLSKPISTEEWRQLRAEMTSHYDFTDLLRKQYHSTIFTNRHTMSFIK